MLATVVALYNAAGLTSPALHRKGVAHDEAHPDVGDGGAGDGGDDGRDGGPGVRGPCSWARRLS